MTTKCPFTLDTIMPNGKKLGDCTFGEVGEIARIVALIEAAQKAKTERNQRQPSQQKRGANESGRR